MVSLMGLKARPAFHLARHPRLQTTLRLLLTSRCPKPAA